MKELLNFRASAEVNAPRQVVSYCTLTLEVRGSVELSQNSVKEFILLAELSLSPV